MVDKRLSAPGPEHITLLCRTILESAGNQDGLTETIISAVSACMEPQWVEKGLDWIAAFDTDPAATDGQCSVRAATLR
jgi:hypothetical protein